MQIRRRVTLEVERPGSLFLLTLALAVILDQVTKVFVRSWLSPGESIPLWSGILDITYVRNQGAAFGLFPGRQSVFILTGILVLVGIAAFWWRRRPRSAWLAVSLGCVGAGALGNLIDRVRAPHLVTDFIDVFGRHFPVFNVADSAISVGVVLLMIWILLVPETTEDSDDASMGHEPTEDTP